MIPFLVLVFVAAGLLIYVGTLYNGLVALRNDIDKAWANIDVLLKQRHDELPATELQEPPVLCRQEHGQQGPRPGVRHPAGEEALQVAGMIAEGRAGERRGRFGTFWKHPSLIVCCSRKTR